jgi:hypothetical protein
MLSLISIEPEDVTTQCSMLHASMMLYVVTGTYYIHSTYLLRTVCRVSRLPSTPGKAVPVPGYVERALLVNFLNPFRRYLNHFNMPQVIILAVAFLLATSKI